MQQLQTAVKSEKTPMFAISRGEQRDVEGKRERKGSIKDAKGRDLPLYIMKDSQ